MSSRLDTLKTPKHLYHTDGISTLPFWTYPTVPLSCVLWYQCTRISNKLKRCKPFISEVSSLDFPKFQ
ncbi:hypothetical protein L5515_015719 [Caenorhabditis briggsae]|uniref:Uncharacterized protein n=1 Tax=Caenorhabditis briggsae TaxID=6238 RepID=A0AAE9EFC9_CAEBR|nr:hypothetical protein L5515_015719 [Caenorhabditis briggsae]